MLVGVVVGELTLNDNVILLKTLIKINSNIGITFNTIYTDKFDEENDDVIL